MQPKCFSRCLVLTAILVGSSAVFVDAGSAVLGGRTFTIPEGMEIELVAGPPLVDRPISAAFDDLGRLYVTDSSGSNEKVKVQLEKKPHRIVRLEDVDGDGFFERSVVFADRLMFPEGILWHAGSVYVAAPPSIWKLTDTDGDGVADQREEWFDAKTLTGCANDLHGPYLGADGWIYWCKGAFAEQTYERPGKPPFVTRASHIFRRMPTGGVVEPVMTGGMDNPIDVIFTPGGERIFTTTFLQHPAGGKRDGLIHAIYGGVYGKTHGVLDGHPRTGPLMPTLVHLGAAAPCGLTRLETRALGADGLGASYQNNLLACLFNMHKVTRHVLKRDGATFTTRDEDFVVCDDLDFHPTDVIEDADGSVLIVDTGGWYKLCCPTSQLYKPDILGGIYRLRRTGGHKSGDPRGLAIDWAKQSAAQLIEALGDARPAVRDRAKDLLAGRGAEVVAALETSLISSRDRDLRLQAVWTLTRISGPEARRAVRTAIADPDEEVRQAATHSISVRRDRQAVPQMVSQLESSSLHNRRAAAEALGRLGDPAAIPALLAAARDDYDRALEHSLIFALIEIDDAKATRLGLVDDSPRTRRAALMALDQMRRSKSAPQLAATEIAPLLGSEEEVLEDTAWWIAGRHPEWAPIVARHFETRLAAAPTVPAALSRLSERLARFAGNADVQALMGKGLSSDLPATVQMAILDAMAKSQLKTLPASWSAQLSRLLSEESGVPRAKLVSTARAFSDSELPPELAVKLRQVARDEDAASPIRLEALAALRKVNKDFEPQVFRFLCAHLSIEQPVRIRALAVDVLTSTKLTTGELRQLADVLAVTGPMEIRRLLAAFDASTDEDVGLGLVSGLARSPALASVPPEELKKLLQKYGAEVLRQGEPLIARIETENREKRERLESILALLEHGDVRRGQRVFQGTKAACNACHALGYLGGRVGPDLSRIGGIRSERDLLEAILFPSASFVRSYEPTVVVTGDGNVVTGVVVDETDREVVLSLDAQKVMRIAHENIAERRDGEVSIMPAGLEKQLSEQELADLIAFLKVAR